MSLRGANCGLVRSIFTLPSEQKALKHRKPKKKKKKGKRKEQKKKTRGYSTINPVENINNPSQASSYPSIGSNKPPPPFSNSHFPHVMTVFH
jgi:hypothetical protein